MTRYGFFSPLDQGFRGFDTLEEARKAAWKYIGKEDWEGRVVRELQVYSLTTAELVSQVLEATR